MKHNLDTTHERTELLTNDLNVDFDNYNSPIFSKFKFDNSHVPLNIQKLFIYLCSFSKCLTKQEQLKMSEFGNQNNLTHYNNRTTNVELLQSTWMSLCPSYILFKEKPNCLSHLNTSDISGKNFSVMERRNLLENDLTNCLNDNTAFRNYVTVTNYVNRMNLVGSINKNWEELVYALKGNYTKSANSKEEDLLFNQNDSLNKEIYQKKVRKIRENMNLDKQFKYVLENYSYIPVVPYLPNFTYYLYSVSAAYCRKQLLTCMANEIFAAGYSDEEIIEKSSIGTVIRCFSFQGTSLESCVLNVARELDDQFNETQE
ncbi:hypothetical protein ABK040_010122 [Willaertia magna]